MEDLHVREATIADKKEVLAMHDNVYEGSDYLPVYYGHFISSPDITPFVLLHKEKIIGYSAAHILDKGETLVTRAVRLNPEYEGKGMYGYLDKRILEWAKSKDISTKAFTTSDQNTNIAKSSFQDVNTLILSKNILIYAAEEKISVETKDENITTVSASLLKTYISAKEFKQYLFPQHRIIVDYVPFKLLDSNVPLMRGPNDVTTIFSDVRCDNNKCTGLLSCGTLYPVKQPSFHCTIEIYGTDESSLKKHLAEHLKAIQQKAVGVTSIGLFIEKQISTDLVDQIFLDYGVKRIIWRDPRTSDVGYTDSHLFEKTL